MPSVADMVLVVDDDAAFHRLVEGVLQGSGVSCVCVRSGEEALRLLKKETPKAVIIDGLLPGIRGDALAMTLREKWEPSELPIIFVSAFFRDMRSRQHLQVKCRVDAVLHKPITPEDLKRALAKIPTLAPPPELVDVPDEIELDITTAVELLSDYLIIATERIDALHKALKALADGEEVESLKTLRIEAHRFRGTGGSFGLPELTRLGGQIEDLLDTQKKGAPVSATVKAQLNGLVNALAMKLSRAGANLSIAGTSGGGSKLRVLLIDGPGELALSCGEAMAKGLPIRLFNEMPEALASLTQERADVVFVAADRPGFDGLDVCETITLHGFGPVVVMGKDPSFAARLTAQSRGARGYVHRLPSAQALLRVAVDFADTPKGLSVLAVSADRTLLGNVAETLSADGHSVLPCLEPAMLFEELDKVAPTLVVLSADLPGVNLMAILRALKGDARHGHVPVLVLTQDDSRQLRLDAFEAGADDVMPSPMSNIELRARVRSWVHRRAHELRLAPLTSLPGLPGIAALREELERALVLARRGRTLALLVFEADLRHLLAPKSRFELDAVVAALGARLALGVRMSDMVASLGGARFGVLLYDASRADAEKLLKHHLERFNSQDPLGDSLHAQVRGGLATFPEVREGADALIDVALRQLETPVT
ncbi:MAG: response regulator [Myxococcaceae bacterium]|nr:response regulator [Myxococcaceae bacterium]